MPSTGMKGDWLTFSAIEIDHTENVGGTALGRTVQAGARGILPGFEARAEVGGSSQGDTGEGKD